MTENLLPPEPVRRDLSPDAVVTALEDNAVESIRTWSAWSELELHEEAELLWTITDLPFPFFNCVVRPRLTPDTVDAAIEASRSRAAKRHVPVSWWLGPAPAPSNVETRLKNAGFDKTDELIGMGVDLTRMAAPPTSPAGLTIEEVTDSKLFRRWCFLLGPLFEFPPRRSPPGTAATRRLATGLTPPGDTSSPCSMASLSPPPPSFWAPAWRASPTWEPPRT